MLKDEDLVNVVGGTKIPYCVKYGDTLEQLAKTFHCTVEDICKWNNIIDPNVLEVNQKLIFKF